MVAISRGRRRNMNLFLSSGDLIADRRYRFATELEARGDPAAAADLLLQAVELAPSFASAWFALGEIRDKAGDRAGAISAFGKAHDADPQDRHGASLRLARLGNGAGAMTAGYVRAMFDEYAPRFDQALEGLSYRAPALLMSAVETACRDTNRPMRFGSMLDLGCGTGLAGAAFRPFVDWLVGIDLSPAMIAQARGKILYDKLAAAELTQFLDSETASSARYELVVAADVFVYLSDLTPVVAAIARVTEPGGLFAFTVETHEGCGVVLGDKLRYAQGEAHVRNAVAGAGLTLRYRAGDSKRNENNVPVPGLVVVAER
jgi:predicted TPR repeat methyltransferase